MTFSVKDILKVQVAPALGCTEPVAIALGAAAARSLLPDDMIRSRGKGALRQMVEIYDRSGHSVIAVEKIPPEDSVRYGVAAVQETAEGLLEIETVVEKPTPEEAPSNLGVVGRYVLTKEIFPLLENLGKGAGGEIQLTDGIARLMEHQKVLAHPFEGQRFDCGSRLGLVLATLEYALADDELAADLESFLEARRSLAG